MGQAKFLPKDAAGAVETVVRVTVRVSPHGSKGCQRRMP